MNITLKNKYIYFATDGCFDQFPTSLKAQLHQKVIANPGDEYDQTISITADQLADVYRTTASQAEGVAAAFNLQMKNALVPQLMAMVQGNDPVAAAEAADALTRLQALDEADYVTRAAKIASGKQRIIT